MEHSTEQGPACSPRGSRESLIPSPLPGPGPRLAPAHNNATNHQKSFKDLNKGLDSIFLPKPVVGSRSPTSPTKESRPPLFKSYSRSQLYEADSVITLDDCEVYHTITRGGAGMAATRAPLPFARIVRRPARLLAHRSLLPSPPRPAPAVVRRGSAVLSLAANPPACPVQLGGSRVTNRDRVASTAV